MSGFKTCRFCFNESTGLVEQEERCAKVAKADLDIGVMLIDLSWKTAGQGGDLSNFSQLLLVNTAFPTVAKKTRRKPEGPSCKATLTAD